MQCAARKWLLSQSSFLLHYLPVSKCFFDIKLDPQKNFWDDMEKSPTENGHWPFFVSVPCTISPVANETMPQVLLRRVVNGGSATSSKPQLLSSMARIILSVLKNVCWMHSLFPSPANRMIKQTAAKVLLLLTQIIQRVEETYELRVYVFYPVIIC